MPGDGTVDSLRDLLDQLHEAAVAVERLSIHNPDLDDVFLAVTGSHVTSPIDASSTRKGALQR